MKRFLIKGVVFLVLLAAVIGICNFGFWRTDPYSTDKFRHIPDQLAVCNIGASHSKYDFDYEDYPEYQTFNFALDSQSHIYDYRILDCYQEHLREGCLVFIAVSYPTILGKDETEREDFNSMNERYYTFLPRESIRNYEWKTALKMKLIPFTYASNARSILSGLLHDRRGIQDYWQRVTTPEEAEKDAEAAYQRHVGKNRDENGKVIYNPEALQAIRDIVLLCQKKGAVPVLITTPVMSYYLEKVKEGEPEFYESGFREAIRRIQEETGVEYYDYSHDERFLHEYGKFMNADHLNQIGAREFTRILMEKVSEKLPG